MGRIFRIAFGRDQHGGLVPVTDPVPAARFVDAWRRDCRAPLVLP